MFNIIRLGDGFVVRNKNRELLGTIRELPGKRWVVQNKHYATNTFDNGWDALSWVVNPVSLRKDYVKS